MLIPILIVRDMPEAIAFHTQVLDFRLAFAWPQEAPVYAGLMRGADELHLGLTPGQGRYGHCSAMVLSDDVDALFATFTDRGLPVPTRPIRRCIWVRWTRAGARANSMSTIPAAIR